MLLGKTQYCCVIMHHQYLCLSTCNLDQGHTEKLSWDIHKLQKHLGKDDIIRPNILFIHAFFGCDTTSQLCGFGKGITLKIFANSESLHNAASVFNVLKENMSKESIILSGKQALACLYNGAQEQGLNSVRLLSFRQK